MRISLIFLAFILSFSSCQKNTITGRKQLILVNEADLQQMALTEYKKFLTQNKVITQGASKEQEMVSRAGKRIANAVAVFATKQGKSDLLKGYQWEFNLVDSKDVNAWCMPGGKVVVYTGLLPVAQNEAGLAVVMGHEIAHAIADHGNERMSQELAVQAAGIGLQVYMQQKPQQTQQIFLSAFGVGSQLGMLGYSRQHELEADKLGLVFMAMAGYNPERAITFWQEMAKLGGAKPPEFMSTHPSDERRIAQIQAFMPEAKKYYVPK